ncbi:MAG: hypothetical protein ACYC26_07250 [Phycisphaerales bacterium]
MNMMRFGCAALTMILLAITGCVELTGQRLSFRYDAEKDELTALLFYDGIHDTNHDSTTPAEDLTEFVKNGDVMLADWALHIFQPAQMKEKLAKADANLQPAERELMRQALESVHTHAIGHYRDAQGRIGAAQAITISDASKLVAAANAWINEQLHDKQIDEHYRYNRTKKLLQDAAKKDHVWLKLDGNSIVYTTPVDRSEWAKLKAEFFADGMSGWGDDAPADDPAQQTARIKRSIRWMTQFLTSAPGSYSEQNGIVTIRLGDPATPNTLRYRVHEQYTDNLVEPVKRNIPADLNAALAMYLIASKPAPNADLDAIIAFGPPEQRVLALLPDAKREVATAEQAIPSGTNAAFSRLRTWAEQWNRKNSYPQAPTEMPMQQPTPANAPPWPDTAAYFKAWDTWLKQMASYPVDADASTE